MKRSSRIPFISLIVVLAANLLGALPNVAFARSTVVSRAPHGSSAVARVAAVQDTTPKEVAFPSTGGWFILYGLNGYAATKEISTDVTDQLDQYQTDSQEVKHVAFSFDGGFVIIYGANGFYAKDVPQTAIDKLTSLNDGGHELGNIAFSPSGEWVILYDANKYATSKKIPAEVPTKLDSLVSAQRSLKSITFSSDGKWLILYNENRYVAQTGFDKSLTDILKEVATKGWLLNQVAFLKVGGASATADASAAASDATAAASDSSAPDLWVVLYGGGAVWSKEGLPETFTDKLKELVTGS